MSRSIKQKYTIEKDAKPSNKIINLVTPVLRVLTL